MSDVPNVLNVPGPAPAPDDPRLLLSEPFRAVHFAYGLFHPDMPPLSGHALIGSLTVLGYTEEASRGIVLRLRRGGFLESRRSGREAAYALSPRSTALIDEIARRSSDPPPAWDASFETLVVQIPASRRAFREQLRRQARYAGFGSPLPGLLIAPYPSSAHLLEPLLAARPPDVGLSRGRLAMDVDDAVRVADAAWDLGPTAAALRRETARMLEAARAVEAQPPDGPDALRLLWQSIGPYFEVLSERPPLPTALLPADWPLEAARTTFFRLAATVAPRAVGYVADLNATRTLDRRR